MINLEKEEFIASIVNRNKSFSVVYTSYKGGKKTQRADNLAELLAEYVELYRRVNWLYFTYTNRIYQAE